MGGKKKKIKVKAGGINGFLDEFSDAEESSPHNEKLVQASRNSARLLLGLRYNSASRSMGEGQQQSLCFMSHPPSPPRNVRAQLPRFPATRQQFTAAKFHFLLPNPIAHYPVHCIRALIFPFSCLREERGASVINPLYSNK